MPMNWEPTTFKQLFANFLVIHGVTSVNYQALAKSMGPDCTPKALQHKFQELKKFSAGAANGIVTAPATPGKRGRSNAVSTPKTPKTNGNKSPAKNIKSGNSKHTRDESELEAHESDADSEAGIKGFDDKDSSDDADQPAVDRSALRRSASSEPGRYEGLDKDTEDKHERAPKRVKKEIHA